MKKRITYDQLSEHAKRVHDTAITWIADTYEDGELSVDEVAFAFQDVHEVIDQYFEADEMLAQGKAP